MPSRADARLRIKKSRIICALWREPWATQLPWHIFSTFRYFFSAWCHSPREIFLKCSHSFLPCRLHAHPLIQHEHHSEENLLFWLDAQDYLQVLLLLISSRLSTDLDFALSSLQFLTCMFSPLDVSLFLPASSVPKRCWTIPSRSRYLQSIF